MPQKERVLFLVLAHISNEIGILHKLAAFSIADPTRIAEPELRGRLAQSMLMLKVLVGKLHEANETVRKMYYKTKLSRSFDSSLSDESRKALDTMNRYFGKSNVVTTTRNQLSVHYDPARYNETYSSFPKDQELLVYAGEREHLFDFAEQIINFSFFGAGQNVHQWHEDIDRILNEVLEVSRFVLCAIGGLITVLVEKHNAIDPHSLQQFEVEPVSISDTTIPFFTTSAEEPR